MKKYEGFNGFVSVPNKVFDILTKADKHERIQVSQSDIDTLCKFKSIDVKFNDFNTYIENGFEHLEHSYYIDSVKTNDCINVVYVFIKKEVI